MSDDRAITDIVIALDNQRRAVAGLADPEMREEVELLLAEAIVSLTYHHDCRRRRNVPGS